MIKLNTSYSKKIPVEGQDFSSQSFHASVELELSDNLTPEQIRDRIHDTAAYLRKAVDDELNGGAQANAGHAPAFSGNSANRGKGGSARPASNKQIKYITDLAAEQNILLADLNADIRRRFGAESLYQLTSKQASALLDEMNAGRHSQRAA
jgi:phage gp36-like protein